MYKALVVDDELPARQAIIALGRWETYGIEPPLEAESAQKALRLLAIYQPSIIFTDMRMPQMDGLNFLAQAVKICPKAKYIIISGYDDFEYARQGMQRGVLDYLLKPIRRQALDAAISKAVAQLDIEESRENDGAGLLARFLREKPQILEAATKERMVIERMLSHPDVENISQRFQDYLAALVTPDMAVGALWYLACEVLLALQSIAFFRRDEKAAQRLAVAMTDKQLTKISSRENFLSTLSNILQEAFQSLLFNADSKAEVVRCIKQLIQENYAGEISLELFAEQFFMTKEYLSRCFKAIEGCGIYEYATKTRMEKAAVLLRDSDAKIQTVANQVGFQDPNHFSRAFKQYFGQHPTEFRQKGNHT